ncbi:MAG TPA: glycoside hydrolase family 2 TIM barrel-domain containing protein [Chloroflexota bacterium]|nr:glycoside hydrolase family 2 TIM barrel-domain containing protein [Chloroflexota bacterium]
MTTQTVDAARVDGQHHPQPQPSALPPPVPRPEHPRPDFQREHWVNLNGRWRFSFDPQNVGEQRRWYRVSHPTAAARLGEVGDPVEDPFGAEITVPFPWESRLSGVNEPNYKGAAWYQRAIEVPAEWAESAPGARGQVVWRRRPILCFGAVDWSARVWVNGRFATEHDGGYTPFEVDLARFVRPGVPATLTVRVWDACDADTPLGKQVDEWYTHSGGIWQTVWLEGRPAVQLARAHVTPHLSAGRADFSLTVTSPADRAGQSCRLRIESSDGLFPAIERTVELEERQTQTLVEVAVPQPRPWSPEEPFLYDCTITLTAADQPVGDVVRTYFGLREVTSQRWENRPYEYVFLNGEPIYLRGVLDQAFHPEGLHAYPSDEVIRGDIQAAKDLGLNFVRCHIKINDPRYYYWCDRLGMLVMYDFPSSSIYTPKARVNWEHTFREALARDYSHPCIFSWILFNETWGLEEHTRPEGWRWVQEMYYLCKQLDPTRLVEDNSPYLYDHVTTDINTWHFYIGDYDQARRHVENVVSQTFEGSPYHFVGGVYADVEGAGEYKQGTQPLINSEYAGISAWGGDRDVSYTFKFLTAELRRHDMVCGYVYTELTDVEWEHNGLLNYDRTPKEFGYDHFVEGMSVADLNAPDFVGLDAPPCQTLPTGGTFRAPIFVSHWDRRPLRDPVVRWRVAAVDRLGERHILLEDERPTVPRRYGVTDGGDLEVQLPNEPCLVTVALLLVDGDTVRARNYVNVEVVAGEALSQVSWSSAAGAERLNGSAGARYALRFLPGDFLATGWADPRIGPRGSKFGGSGAGWVEYAVALPGEVDPARVKRLRLVFEAGARTAKNRLDWRDARHNSPQDYPQTEQRKVPSDLVVRVNGVRLGALRLPDDPADARGVLSAHASPHWEPCSYGFLTVLDAEGETAQRILTEAKDGRLVVRFEVPPTGVAGGLNLYGARMGAYPIDPLLLIET